MCSNVKLPMSAFIFNIIWFGHHTRKSCQLLFPHGTFGKSQHGNLQVPLGILMAITRVGKHLMDLDVCTGKEGKGGLSYENTLIENTFLDPTTRNVLNT